MKYQKAVELTQEVQRALYAKDINFQRGQLVTVNGSRGRFVKRSSQMIHVVWNPDTNFQGFKKNCVAINIKRKAGRRLRSVA